MEHVSNVSSQSGADRLAQLRLAQSEAQTHPVAPPSTAEPRADEAEISELGRILGQAHEQPGIRADKVAAARLALQENEELFITERLGPTIDSVIAELDDA